MKEPKIIAFYLPQYYPTKHNDEWWGKGFTEWTNVAKAKKLYPGHYQPKIPADLGFYDLRLPIIREEQAMLAREAGIYGFCYYHYWFSNGQEELDVPFKEVVRLGTPDFPFCLCWANESWYSKFWNKDGRVDKKILVEQQYLGKDDNEVHFYSLLKAFSDRRYIKIDGKLLFLIYNPYHFENFKDLKNQWNQLARQHNLPEFYFVAQTLYSDKIDEILAMGFDGVNHCHRLDNILQYKLIRKCFNLVKRVIRIPFVVSYKKAIENSVDDVDFRECVFPTMMPNWDHTPRSNDGGSVLHNATPELFKKHAVRVLKTIVNKSDEHKIVFVKSWNEWGEGNYMEPDLKYGKGYINALRTALDELI